MYEHTLEWFKFKLTENKKTPKCKVVTVDKKPEGENSHGYTTNKSGINCISLLAF